MECQTNGLKYKCDLVTIETMAKNSPNEWDEGKKLLGLKSFLSWDSVNSTLILAKTRENSQLEALVEGTRC